MIKGGNGRRRFGVLTLLGVYLLATFGLALTTSQIQTVEAAGNVDQFCKNNSSDIKGSTLTVARDSSDLSNIIVSYSVSHVSLSSGQNIGITLYSTHVVNGTQADFTELKFVSHVEDESKQRKKDSPTKSSGSFSSSLPSDGSTYKYVLLAYSPADASGSQTAVSGNEVLKNRCSAVNNFSSTYDTSKPPAPTSLQVSFSIPSAPESGDINLSWNWSWPSHTGQSFEIVYTKPSASSSTIAATEASAQGGAAGLFLSNVYKLATLTGVNTFGIRAVVNGKKSDISQNVTVEFDSSGKFVSYSYKNTSGQDISIDRDSMAKLSPIAVNSSDPCAEGGISALLNKGIATAITTAIGCFFVDVIRKVSVFVGNFFGTLGGMSMINLFPSKIASGGMGSFFIGSAHADDGSLEAQLGNPDSTVVSIWKVSLGLLNIIVILALLAIAFGNILHLNLNTYAAKKALPGLIIGVVGANASLYIVRFLVDVADATGYLAASLAHCPGVLASGGGPCASPVALITAFPVVVGEKLILNSVDAMIAGGPLTVIVFIIVGLYYLFLIIMFCWFMLKRLVYLYSLIMIAPLGFTAYGIPGFSQYFTKWWDMFLRQLFVLPIILLGMALVTLLAEKFPIRGLVVSGLIDVTSWINLAILFTATTFILKIPGIITKGVLDVAGAAQKALGLAKGAPIGYSALMQGRNDAAARKLKALGADKKGHAQYAEYQKLKDRSKRWGLVRARANIVANPQATAGDWLQKRWKVTDKNTNIETLKSKGQDVFAMNALGKRRGLGFGLSNIWYKPGKEMPTAEPFLGREAAFMAEDPTGAIARYKKQYKDNYDDEKRVSAEMNDPGRPDKQEVLNAIKQLLADGGKKGEEKYDLISRLSNVSNDKQIKELEDLLNPYKSNKDEEFTVEGISDIAGGYNRLFNLMKSRRRGDKRVIKLDQVQTAAEQGNPDDIEPPNANSKYIPLYPYGAPHTGSAAVNDLSEEMLDQAAARAEQAFEIGSRLRPEVGLDVQKNLSGIMEKWDDIANSYGASINQQLESIPAEQLNASDLNLQDIRENTIKALSQSLQGDAKQLEQELKGKTNQQLKEMTEDLSLSLAHGIKGVGANLTAGEVKSSLAGTISQSYAGQGTARQVNQNLESNPEMKAALDEKRLADLIGESVGGSVDKLADHLETTLKSEYGKVAQAYGKQADPAQMKKFSTDMAEEIRRAYRDPNKGVIAALKNMGGQMVKSMGYHQLDTPDIIINAPAGGAVTNTPAPSMPSTSAPSTPVSAPAPTQTFEPPSAPGADQTPS